MTKTTIEWTDVTWGVVRGCARVSPGCERCYAERMAHRFSGKGQPYEGLTVLGKHGPRWTGRARFVPEKLAEPLAWKKPRRCFVNSMSDLFHADITNEQIAAVFGVMAATPHITYQVLTKRAERLPEWFEWTTTTWRGQPCDPQDLVCAHAASALRPPTLVSFADVLEQPIKRAIASATPIRWPLPNVHLGVSVEDQQRADERVPLLLDPRVQAAVKWVSAEPLLGPVDFADHLRSHTTLHMRADVLGMLRNRSFYGLQHADGREMSRSEAEDCLWHAAANGIKFIPVGECANFSAETGCPGHPKHGLGWVVVGGESGPRARACDLRWIRSIVEQCSAASVPCFVKQLGAEPWEEWHGVGHGKGRLMLADRAGGDPSEWPRDLRVREWPRHGGRNEQRTDRTR